MHKIELNEMPEASFPCWKAADKGAVARFVSGGEE